MRVVDLTLKLAGNNMVFQARSTAQHFSATQGRLKLLSAKPSQCHAQAGWGSKKSNRIEPRQALPLCFLSDRCGGKLQAALANSKASKLHLEITVEVREPTRTKSPQLLEAAVRCGGAVCFRHNHTLG